MLKRLLSILIIAVLALSALPLTASAAGPIYVTVITYDEMNPMYMYEIMKGDAFDAPEESLLIPDGMTFIGWFLDGDFTQRYEDGSEVYSSITLYPRIVSYDDVVYVNYFLDPESEYPIGSDVYAVGDVPAPPANPEKLEDGVYFYAWYIDRELTAKYRFNHPLEDTVNLFARYVTDDDIVHLIFFRDVEDMYPSAYYMCAKGDTPEPLEEPGREGEVFMGWYSDRELTTPFDFYEPMYEDSYLFPRFVQASDTAAVYFYMGPDKEYPYESRTVVRGERVAKPADPYIDDLVFEGWYTDTELKNKYDFTRPVDDYMNLYANFVTYDECYDVWLYLDADALEPTSGFDVPKGNPCPEPGDPGREGYEFMGWYTDRDLTEPADFTSPRYENVSLFPMWMKKPAYTSYTIGDVNADKDVNNRDAMILDRYVADWPGYDEYIKIMDAADLDRKGTVDNRDAMILDRYVAGWTGYERYIVGVSMPG